MYAYFYIDKDDNLIECDRNTYKKWEFSLNTTPQPCFFYLKERKVFVECPNSDLYYRLEDKYGNGAVVMDSEFSVKDKNYGSESFGSLVLTLYTIVTDIHEVYFTDDDDSYRGFYGYYPTFGTNVRCYSNDGNCSGQLYKITDCPNYGLEKAIEYHESIILDIVSGKDLKYIS